MILTLREDPCVKGVHRFSSATAFSWLRWLLPHRQGRGIFISSGTAGTNQRKEESL